MFLDKPSDLFAVSYDGLKVSAEPCALVKINRTEQVGELLKLANELEVPVTCGDRLFPDWRSHSDSGWMGDRPL